VTVTDRYRRWTKLAYLNESEKLPNRALWALLVVASVYVVAHHTWLVNIPRTASKVGRKPGFMAARVRCN